MRHQGHLAGVMIALLILPALAPAALAEVPLTGTSLDAPIQGTVGAGVAALDASQQALLDALESAALDLELFQNRLLDEEDPQLDDQLLLAAGHRLVDAGAGLATGQGGLLQSLASTWTGYAAGVGETLHAYANETALVTFDQSLPNGLVVAVSTVPSPGTPGAPIAELQDGRYHFTFHAVDLAGNPVFLGSWRLEVLGLQVLPGRQGLDIPGLASPQTPVATLTRLFEAESGDLRGAVLDPAPCAGAANCVSLGVPAGPLKLERLYAGSQVLLKFVPDQAAGKVAWHNSLARAAYDLHPEEPLGGGAAKRSLVIADVLDQFPTPMLLAPSVQPGPDGDADGWNTTTEVSLNSDPFDSASRPGLDDDADGILNYLEGSRANATNWLCPRHAPQGGCPQPVPEADPLFSQRVPLAGVAVVVAEAPALAPPDTILRPELEDTLRGVLVFDVGVAGPPRFTLTGLTLETLGDLRAGEDAELQAFRLARVTPEGEADVAAWSYDAGKDEWVPGTPGLVLDCSGPCRGDTASWSLGGLEVAGEHALRFRLYLDAAPGALDPDALDHKTFQALLPTKGVTLDLPLAPAGPNAPEPGPVAEVDVTASRIAFEALSDATPVTGTPVTLAFCGVDARGSRDADYGALAPTAVELTFTRPVPATYFQNVSVPDLNAPVGVGADAGCAHLDLTLVYADAQQPFGTAVRATDLLLGSATTATTPVITTSVGPAGALELVAMPTKDDVGYHVNADLAALPISVFVRDAFGNLHGDGTVVNFDLHGLIPENVNVPTQHGLATHIMATTRDDDEVFSFTVTSGAATTGLQQAVVVPGRLQKVDVLDFDTGVSPLEPIVRARRLATTPPLETDPTFDGAWLLARSYDGWWNLIESYQDIAWTAHGGLAGVPNLLNPEPGIPQYVSSPRGGLEGTVCALAPAFPDAVGDCVALRFTGRTGPTVTLGCLEPNETAHTGQPFELCATLTDDVGVVTTFLKDGKLAHNLTVVQDGASTTVVLEQDAQNPTFFRGTFPVPLDTLGQLVLNLEVADAQELVGTRAVGGTDQDGAQVNVEDVVPPTAALDLEGPVILHSEGPLYAPAGAANLTAADNIGNPPVRLQGAFDDAPFGAPVYAGLLPLPFTNLTSGPHVVRALATDGAGATDEATRAFFVDADGPVTTLDATKNVVDGVWVVNPADPLRLTAVDRPEGLPSAGVAQIFYRYGGDPRPLPAVGGVVDPPHGTQTLTFWSVDALGNREADQRLVLTADVRQPFITVLVPAQDAFLNLASPTFRATVADDGPLGPENVTVALVTPQGTVPVTGFTVTRGASPSLLQVEGVLPALGDGAYRLIVNASDALPLNGTASRRFTVDLTPPAATAALPALVRANALVSVAVNDTHLASWNLTAVNAGTSKLLTQGTEPFAGNVTLPTTTLADGPVRVVLQAVDKAGNTNAPTDLLSTVDNTPPQAGLDALAAVLAEPRFPLSWGQIGGSDAATYDVDFRVGDGNWTALLVGTPLNRTTFDLAAAAPGIPLGTAHNVTFRVRATDQAGNVGTFGLEVRTLVDTTTPVAVLLPFARPALAGSVSVAGQAGVPGQQIQGWILELSRDGGSTWSKLANGTNPRDGPLADWNTKFEPDGTKTLRLRTTTLGGRVGETLLTVPVDNTPPSVRTLLGDGAHAASGAWSSVAATTLTWELVEAGSGVEALTCSLGTQVLPGCGPTGVAFTAPPGPSTFHLDVVDRAGNRATRASFPLQVDLTSPVVSNLATPPSPIREGVRAVVNATVTDAHSGVRSAAVLYQLNGGPQVELAMAAVGGPGFTATLPSFGPGTLRVQVLGRDNVGRTSLGEARTLAVADATPPTVRIVQPTSPTLNGLVPVQVDLSDAGSGVRDVLFQLRNAGGVVHTLGPFPAAQGRFTLVPDLDVTSLANGAYDLVVDASDVGGNHAVAVLAAVVANAPTIQPPADPVVDPTNGTAELRVQVSGGTELQVLLHHKVRGEARPPLDMTRDGTSWVATVGGLAPGDLLNYFIEARDGSAASRRPADGSLLDVPVPILAAQLTNLTAWNATETLTNATGDSEGHAYVEIVRGQFTHDRVTATFGFLLNGSLPEPDGLGGAPIPRYRVEFRLDPSATNPDLTLEATYAGSPSDPANWEAYALDSAEQPVPAVTATVTPDADAGTLALQAPVGQLRDAFGAGFAFAEARFRALGSNVATAFAPFDIANPSATLVPPAGPVTDQTPVLAQLQQSASVTDNLQVSDLAVNLEVSINQQLTVLRGTLDPVTGGLGFPGLDALLPGGLLPAGTTTLVLTAVDKAGNTASTALPPIAVADVTKPTASLVRLNGTAFNLANPVPLQVPVEKDVPFAATLLDAVGLGAATVQVEGKTLPLVVDQGQHTALLHFTAPGEHLLTLVFADLAGNQVLMPLPVLVQDLVPPVVAAVALRPAGTDFDPAAPSLAQVEVGQPVVVTALVTDNAPLLGASAVATLTSAVNGGTCTLPLAATATPGVFEAPLACTALSLGPFSFVVTATDASGSPDSSLPMPSLLQDSVLPVLSLSGLPGVFNDAQAENLRLTVDLFESGRLVDATAALVRADNPTIRQSLGLAKQPGVQRLALPAPLLPGNYLIEVVAVDQGWDGTALALALRTVTATQAILVDDKLGPALLLDEGAPGPGVVVPTEQVVLSGRLLDFSGVATESVRVLIDGQRPGDLAVTPASDFLRQGFAFSASATLGKGRHELRFAALDLAGNALDRSWAFFVLELPPATVVAAPAPAPATPAPAPGASAPPASSGGAAPPCPTCLQQTNVPAAPPPPVVMAAPTLPAAGSSAQVDLTSPASPLTVVGLAAEEPTAGARVVARSLARSELAPHDFEALFQQVELRVEDGTGDVAPVVLSHVGFRVPRSFVDGAGLDAGQAVLMHLEEDGSWSPRDTTLVDVDGQYYQYDAAHGGRSTFAIVFDRAPPVVELIAPSVASILGSVSLEAVARDDTAVKELFVTLNGALIGSGAPILRLVVDASTLAQIAEGSMTLAAEAKDATGKAGRAIKVVLLEQPINDALCPDPGTDQAAPVTTLSYEGGDAALFGDILGIKGPVDIRFRAVDQGPEDCKDVTIVETRYSVDGGPVLAGLHVALRADQPHTLEYWSVDSKGNEEAHRSLRVVPAEGADTSEPGAGAPEALEAPKGTPGFEAALLALAALGVALAQGRGRRRA